MTAISVPSAGANPSLSRNALYSTVQLVRPLFHIHSILYGMDVEVGKIPIFTTYIIGKLMMQIWSYVRVVKYCILIV